MRMTRSKVSDFLLDLGLTPLESKVYVFLVGESPATGYRIAQAMGKTAASIYKTLDSLEKKGMIVVDEGERRLCKAVPPREMLNRWERRFLASKKKAEAELIRIESARTDERIYQVRSLEAVMEHCRSMLSRVKRIVIADLFPRVLNEIRQDLEAAATRGVEVRLKVYEQSEIKGAAAVVHAGRASFREDRPYEWLGLVIDGTEFLLANFASDGEGVHQAVWSESPYLSWIYHCGIESEMIVDQVVDTLDKGGGLKDIGEIVSRYKQLDLAEIPGYLARLKRLGAPGGSVPDEK